MQTQAQPTATKGTSSKLRRASLQAEPVKGHLSARGHYSTHTAQVAPGHLTGCNRFFGDCGLVGWYGYQYSDSHAETQARRFAMVADDFGQLFETTPLGVPA